MLISEKQKIHFQGLQSPIILIFWRISKFYKPVNHLKLSDGINYFRISSISISITYLLNSYTS